MSVVFPLLVLLWYAAPSISAEGRKEPLFLKGEKISYAIKKLGVKGGEAELIFGGLTKIQNKDAYLLTFTAKALNFFDQEKIYMDPVSFYPLRIERDLNLWGKKEKITEEYQANGRIVKITKRAKGKTTQQTIAKETRLDNIYSFLYRYRRLGQFRVGDSFTMHLPTQDLKFHLQKIVKVKAAGQTYDSFYLKSEPARYEVWFDAGAKKIPLKINGAIGLGDTLMVMVEYEEQGNSQ